MKFLALEIENVGVFGRPHRFDLSVPETLEHQTPANKRNLVLVRGHNGAGKSTLFNAFQLALHGVQSLSDRLSRADANDLLMARLHRKNKSEVARQGRVFLSFEYIESGRPLRFEVERLWTRNGRVVTEEIGIRRNGAKPDGIKSSDYNAYLADLFPGNLGPVCFFDAERLDALSSLEGSENLLATTMRRLLGLDVVERLREDLDVHTLRQGGRSLEPLRRTVFECQQEWAKAKADLENAKNEVAMLAEQLTDIRAKITESESKLSASGGTYAQRRPQLLEQRASVKEKIEQLGHDLRELCEGLLPFALAPALCQQLKTRLSLEAQNAQNSVLHAFWANQVRHVESLVAESKDESSVLGDRILESLRASEPELNSVAPLHLISELERDKLRGWLGQVFDEVPQTAKETTSELRELRQNLKDIETELERAPEDDTLSPIYETIVQWEEELAVTSRKHDEVTASLGGLEFGCAERERVYNQAVEEFLDAQKTRQKLALAERSKMVLRVYKDTLTRNQVARLEVLVAENFNRICQKERLLRNVVINPETFALLAQDAAGRPLGLSDLSAGERQLYSLSLLWALRQLSGREMPLLIDTPLGRLDETHRDRLLDVFFPDVGRQVLLFTTTSEVDANVLRHLEPRLARHYALQFDAMEEETEVRPVPVHRPAKSGEVVFNGRNLGTYIPLQVGE